LLWWVGLESTSTTADLRRPAGVDKLLFSFDNFSLDSDRRELRRNGDLRAIEPQVFDVLEYLIRHRDRVVTKDDLLAAVWNGRIVSEATLSSRINAARIAIDDNGEEQRLIRTILRKGVRFVGTVREASKSAPAGEGSDVLEPQASALALPDRPSIAVLPFANISGDAEQEYFADGIVEEIITALSRFRQLFVIARNSSFTYKGRAVDVTQVGRELGVRYVLEGSVRKSSNRARITGQLIDASSGAHIWADRFDGALDDIFDLQEQMTTSVVGGVAPRLEEAEIARAKRKPTESLDAYDCYLRGMAYANQGIADNQAAEEAYAKALRMFYRAIGLDSDFACAYGMAAWCYVVRKACAWTTDRQQETAETARLVRSAVEMGKDDAVALCRAGHALAFVVGDHEPGVALIDRALSLNPNLMATWYSSGFVRVWSGEPDVAIEHMTRAMHLSPLDPLLWAMRTAIAFAHFFAGRNDEARLWAAKALRDPNVLASALRISAASNAVAGHMEEARHAMAQLRQIDPNRRISNLSDVYAIRRPHDAQRLREGLRRAGLPE
jgi:TolB-like protein/tetratricopeptide (TPR) repeat protein